MAEQLTLDEAAGLLGVTRRRVQAMVHEGILPAKRLGRQWIVPIAALRQADHNRSRHPGRPLSQRSAWQLVDELPTSALHGEALDDLRRRLRSRAVHRSGYVHPAIVRDLMVDPRVVLGGLDAAFGSAEGGADIDVYVRRSDTDAVLGQHHVDLDESDAVNVHLHIVDDDAWPFPDDQRTAGPWVGWLDLADRRDRHADVALDRRRGRHRL